MSKRPLCFRARPTATFVFSISSLRGSVFNSQGDAVWCNFLWLQASKADKPSNCFPALRDSTRCCQLKACGKRNEPIQSSAAQWIPLLLGMQTPQPAASLVQLASKLASNLCRENLSPAKGHLKSCCWVLVAHAAGENVPCFLQGIH